MKRLIFPILCTILLFGSCKENISPDLAFDNLILDKVENSGYFHLMQKNDYVITNCDSFLRAKSYKDPYNPGSCEGIINLKIPVTKTFLFSSDGNNLIMWDESVSDPVFYALNIQDPLNIEFLGSFNLPNSTIIAWENHNLYVVKDYSLITYNLNQLTPTNNLGDLGNYKVSEIILSGALYANSGYFIEDFLYFGASSFIYVINYSDKSNPKVESIVRVQSNSGFIPYEKYLIALGNQEVTFLDVSDPAKPIPSKRISTGFYNGGANPSIAVHGHYLYTGAAAILSIYDIEDVNQIELVKVIDCNPEEIQTFNFFGDYIVCETINRTWATPYVNKTTFINNIP